MDKEKPVQSIVENQFYHILSIFFAARNEGTMRTSVVNMDHSPTVFTVQTVQLT